MVSGGDGIKKGGVAGQLLQLLLRLAHLAPSFGHDDLQPLDLYRLQHAENLDPKTVNLQLRSISPAARLNPKL